LDTEQYISPDPQVGGWTKFVKDNITSHSARRKKLAELYYIEQKEKQRQLKKNRRGWLHI